jgi:catechol 2,3-dioxygenase-like lactoylglutathione lyase family enzyme
MNGAVPTLRITDYEAAKRFYVAGLGFGIDWEWQPEPSSPVFAQLSRGALRFYLSEHEGDGAIGGLVHLYVGDVDAWQAEMLQRGIVAEGAPADQPWGNREMRLRDPDGNQLCICAVLSERTQTAAPGSGLDGS